MQVVSIIPAQYFRRRRGLANGIVFAGGGLGGAVISLSMSAIVERLGTAWTFRLIGLVMLATGLPAAWFLKERTPIQASTFVEWYRTSTSQLARRCLLLPGAYSGTPNLSFSSLQERWVSGWNSDGLLFVSAFANL